MQTPRNVNIFNIILLYSYNKKMISNSNFIQRLNIRFVRLKISYICCRNYRYITMVFLFLFWSVNNLCSKHPAPMFKCSAVYWISVMYYFLIDWGNNGFELFQIIFFSFCRYSVKNNRRENIHARDLFTRRRVTTDWSIISK